MADPFATALAALHSAAGSVAAAYTFANGSGTIPIRVIRHQPSEVIGVGNSHAILDGSTLSIQKSDIAQPVRGDLIIVYSDDLMLEGESLEVLADGVLDAEGLSWMVQAT